MQRMLICRNSCSSDIHLPHRALRPPSTSFISSFNTNTVSVYATIQESIKSFSTLPDTASKTFIYTGNRLNVSIMPQAIDLTVGKAASAKLIDVAATVYADKGMK